MREAARRGASGAGLLLTDALGVGLLRPRRALLVARRGGVFEGRGGAGGRLAGGAGGGQGPARQRHVHVAGIVQVLAQRGARLCGVPRRELVQRALEGEEVGALQGRARCQRARCAAGVLLQVRVHGHVAAVEGQGHDNVVAAALAHGGGQAARLRAARREPRAVQRRREGRGRHHGAPSVKARAVVAKGEDDVVLAAAPQRQARQARRGSLQRLPQHV